jgi:cell division cycle 20-like protein 1 (cofactor of APC complex)
MQIESPEVCKRSDLKLHSDRFIPKRVSPNQFRSCQGGALTLKTENQNKYANLLEEGILGNSLGSSSKGNENSSYKKKRKLLKFQTDLNPKKLDFSEPADIPAPAPQSRKIPNRPYKVLSLPGLQDDFYINLLDWSSNNLIAAGVGESAYVWSANNNSKVVRLCNWPCLVSSVSFMAGGQLVGFANNNSEIVVKDIGKNKSVYKSFGEHSGRVGSLDFSGACMASGGRDGRVVIHDIRSGHSVFRYEGHSQ